MTAMTSDGQFHDIGTRHGFLAALHDVLRPRIYLEVGVQWGTSLNLAVHSTFAIGIDPNPLVTPIGNQTLFVMTSDEFFRGVDPNKLADPRLGDQIDLAFIDGMHLCEYAWRDFQGIEPLMTPRTGVVVFDDVLPRNEFEARRLAPGEPILGDWTGDVWKVHQMLYAYRTLTLRLVDTQPTGLLIVTGFPDPQPSPDPFVAGLDSWIAENHIPSVYLDRDDALQPLTALQQIRGELGLLAPQGENT